MPIVFVIVIDPVDAGFVASLARPGGNATGFLMLEYGSSGKWLELLKQIAPPDGITSSQENNWNTGMVFVAALAARPAGNNSAAMTDTWRLTRSAANAGSRL